MDDVIELRETFDHYDGDSNGIIDGIEFGRLCRALGAEFTDEEIGIGFGEIDSDGNGVIDFDEFSEWWSQR